MNTRTITLSIEEINDVIALIEKAQDEQEDMPESFALKHLADIFKTAL